MADRVSPKIRSFIMASVGTRNTGPELILRRSLHALGYRYVLHASKLPGSPDLSFPRRRKAIFIHGCFWHGHRCRWGRLPKSRTDYWKAKIQGNRRRDRRNLRDLAKLGWTPFVVWQCELRQLDRLLAKVTAFLEGGR